MVVASTSLGEASARTQATDLERRKTPRVRTAPPGLRVEPKWLPVSDKPCSAKALTREVPIPGSSARVATSGLVTDGTRVCRDREEVMDDMSSDDDPYPSSPNLSSRSAPGATYDA
jgi:hypothetical protein